MMVKKIKLNGVILLGGKSSRMGQDKRFLLYNNETFLHKAINLLNQVGCQKIILSGTTKSFFQNIYLGKAEDANKLVFLQDNTATNCGPMAGILSALQTNYKADWLLIIPVDMPLLNLNVIDTLQNILQYSSQKNQCIHFDEYVFPFFLRNTKEVLKIVKDCLQQQKYALRGLLGATNSVKVEPGLKLKDNLVNINTVAEYNSIIF